MKAIILSAGKGKRLRPLTKTVPKPLLPVNGRSLLDRWLECFEKNGFSEVLINAHHLHESVRKFVNKARQRFKLKINYVFEKELLGTGGTVKSNYQFIKDEDFFVLCHGDNFTDIDLADMISFHKRKKTDLSLALFKSPNPKQCGIVDRLDDSGLIQKFSEKPNEPISDLASAAIFILAPRVVECIPPDRVIDFSSYVLPRYQGKMFGYLIKGFNIDIGTIDNYKYANKIAVQAEKKPFQLSTTKRS